MGRQKKVAALAAFLGFLGCTLGTAGVLATACPSKSCEPCPIVFCHTFAANPSPKVDATLALPAAAFHPILLAQAAAPSVSTAQMPPFLSHGFRRPMRN